MQNTGSCSFGLPAESMMGSVFALPDACCGHVSFSMRLVRALTAVSASPSSQQQPSSAARMPLNIPIGRRSTGAAGAAGTSAPGAAGPSAAEAGPSTGQQQQDRTAQPRQQGQQRRRPASAEPSSDVIIVDSDSDDDNDVVITGYKPAPKRPRLAPPQQPAAAAAAGGGPQQPAGQRVERGLHGGYFVMPTWSPQDKQQKAAAAAAAPAPPPREASPEPLFKCLICLDGIKPDNMGITPCG